MYAIRSYYVVTNVHIVTADIGAVHNLVTCCNKAGLEVAELVLESIASANAVLSPDEMELGVALVDIGGGTTDLAVFCDGTIRHTREIGFVITSYSIHYTKLYEQHF